MKGVWLIILALTSASACAAQDTQPQGSQQTSERLPAPQAIENMPDDTGIFENIAKQVPELSGKNEACVNAFMNHRVKQLRVAFGHETGEVDRRSHAEVITAMTECASPPRLKCSGIKEQGGLLLCQTTPNAKVKIGRSDSDFYYENADKNGTFILGFDRDEAASFVEAEGTRLGFDLTPREYDTSRIDGLPPSQVSTFTKAQLARIRSSSARKAKGFASRAPDVGFDAGFISPMREFRKTTNFGAQRILNGEAKKPHYGVDMAAPVGTPIYAPADGLVSLSDDDLYFEGAMVLLDHGQGLISMYLHVDEMLVQPGERVVQGQQIATVGSKGRSTGPHLCWRLKWRNRNLDPELITKWSERAQVFR
jgi:murein DD-endopeptidase MepM/ murein hydrolase activator NlpD